MKPFDPVDVVIRYHAAIEARDFASLEQMFAADAVYVSPGLGSAVTGREAILESFRRYFAEYSDQTSSDDSIEAVDAFCAKAHWQLEATSSRTGRARIRRGIEIVCFNTIGQIVSVDVSDAVSD